MAHTVKARMNAKAMGKRVHIATNWFRIVENDIFFIIKVSEVERKTISAKIGKMCQPALFFHYFKY